MDTSLNDIQQRVAELDARLENALALDARLEAMEDKVGKLGRSSFRDWMGALAPYVSGLVVLFVGFWIKDSVQLAMQRQQLDLNYVTQMRDLIRDFDKADSQASADANAVALSLFGKYAILPLVERLEGGDVSNVAAEKGLRDIGDSHSISVCSKFAEILDDKAHRFTWQTHKTMIRVIGQSCFDPGTRAVLMKYRSDLDAIGSDTRKTARFSQRYSEPKGFDIEGSTVLRDEIDKALKIIESRVQS
jgi:hypothetical protein